jgi:hypothetical protein
MPHEVQRNQSNQLCKYIITSQNLTCELTCE